LGREDLKNRQVTLELRNELDRYKELVRELETELGRKRKKIRELEAGKAVDEYSLGSAWTNKKVWPFVYKGLVRAFHPDKTSVHDDKEKLETFFKIVSDKNDTFNGKGRQSAAEMTAREEMKVAAREKREKAAALA